MNLLGAISFSEILDTVWQWLTTEGLKVVIGGIVLFIVCKLTNLLVRRLNKRLENSPWLGGENYSIADIACWPWVNAWTRQRIDLAMYPAVKNWHERIRSRPATGQALLKAQLGDERSDS